jgi:VanZ family protein
MSYRFGGASSADHAYSYVHTLLGWVVRCAPMSRKHRRQPAARRHWIHSTRLHVVLYTLLLVATPFLILRRFLQTAIAEISRATVPLGGFDLPIVPIVGAITLIAAIFVLRPWITRLRLVAVALVVAMIAVGQQVNDYYYDHRFYDLQQNWHYLAYLLFALMLYRDLAPRGYTPAPVIATTFCAAFAFSTFDELVQIGLSGRAFEMGDIGKDVWGALAGLVLIYGGENPHGALLTRRPTLRPQRVAGYFTNPQTLLAGLILFALLLLTFSSLMYQARLTGVAIVLTLATFAAIFTVWHASRYRAVRLTFAVAVVMLVVAQGAAYWHHRHDQLVQSDAGIVLYKGVPLVVFDYMIFPDGTCRPVEKKTYFDSRDQRFFMKQRPDILLIAAGPDGSAGRGFPQRVPAQFIYNGLAERGMQVIVLPTASACETFNRLKQEHKHVLFILHNPL